jgi:peroxiredoxin
MASHVTIDLNYLSKIVVKGPATLANYLNLSLLPEAPMASQWEGGRSCLLFVIRRLGCPICRTTAMLLSSIKPQLEAQGVKLAAVTFQTGEELRDFLQGGFFQGDIFLDPYKGVYQATETSGFWGMFKFLGSLFGGLSPDFKERTKKTPGNRNEVTTVYSTILVVREGRIVFEQKYVEDPKVEEILRSLGIQGLQLESALNNYHSVLKGNPVNSSNVPNTTERINPNPVSSGGSSSGINNNYNNNNMATTSSGMNNYNDNMATTSSGINTNTSSNINNYSNNMATTSSGVNTNTSSNVTSSDINNYNNNMATSSGNVNNYNNNMATTSSNYNNYNTSSNVTSSGINDNINNYNNNMATTSSNVTSSGINDNINNNNISNIIAINAANVPATVPAKESAKESSARNSPAPANTYLENVPLDKNLENVPINLNVNPPSANSANANLNKPNQEIQPNTQADNMNRNTDLNWSNQENQSNVKANSFNTNVNSGITPNMKMNEQVS